VKVSFKPGVFPAELQKLENKIRSGDFTVEEVKECQKMQWDFAKNLLQVPLEESFNVEVLENFTWEPDPYIHYGKRGDIINKNIK